MPSPDAVLLEMTGQPGDYVRIVPKSDPSTWYEGTILAVYVNAADGLPMGYRLKVSDDRYDVRQQTIPWAAIESINFVDFAPDTEEPQP